MLSGVAFLSLAGSAFALDGADLLTKLNAAYSQQGGTIAATGIDIADTTVTLKGATFKPNGDGEPLKIGDVTLTGVEKQDDGGYYIEEAAFPNFNTTEDGVTLTAEDMSLGDVWVPADPKADGVDGMLIYQTAHAGAVKAVKDGAEIFSISDSNLNMTLRDDQSGFDFDGALKGVKIDLSKAEDAKSKEALEKLALQHVNADVTVKGAWDLGPGTINVPEFAIDVSNVGKLKLALNISGYTPQFQKSMQEAIKASASDLDKSEGQQALGLSMLGLMQQLSFAGAEIRFDDASITKRVLDYAGAQQGMSGKQLADSLKVLAPIMVAQANIPALQNAISAAVNTYLDDPKSLTISAKPEKPVPLPMIVGAAMGDATTLPQVVGLKISAND
jgi:hypothetical protein